MFQIDDNWSDPNNVIEKVEDVIESISITQEIAGKLNEFNGGALSCEKLVVS